MIRRRSAYLYTQYSVGGSQCTAWGNTTRTEIEYTEASGQVRGRGWLRLSALDEGKTDTLPGMRILSFTTPMPNVIAASETKNLNDKTGHAETSERSWTESKTGEKRAD